MCPRQHPKGPSGMRLVSGEVMGMALSWTSAPSTPSMNSICMLLRAACNTMRSRRSVRDGRPITKIFSNCSAGSHLGHHSTTNRRREHQEKRKAHETHAKCAVTNIARETARCGPAMIPLSVPNKGEMELEHQELDDDEGAPEGVENPSPWQPDSPIQ